MLLFSSRSRHTRCALVTVVQTCALPIWGERYEVESLAGARRIGEHCDIHLAGTAVGAHLCKGRWHTVDRRALHRGLRHGPAFLRKVAQNVHHISFQISLISPGAEQGLRIGAADRNRFSAVLHREAFGDRERETEKRMNEGTALTYAMLWIIAITETIKIGR